MLSGLWDEIPEEKVTLQFLVDEFCLTSDSHNVDLNELKALPTSLLLRCIRRLSELRDVEKEQQEEGPGKRCYLEHADLTEKQEGNKLHMRYDNKVGHGFFE